MTKDIALSTDPRDTVGTGPDTQVVPANQPSAALAPLDMDPAVFREALARRKKNYKAFIKWVGDALVEGVDFGRIPVRWKDKQTGEWKTTISKPSLWKPGAEKVCGILGLVSTFPNAGEYERLALEGKRVDHVVLRCDLLNSADVVVSTGMGARIVESDKGDINKSLKMALKSALTDAVLRCGGLSGIFTQDVEEINEYHRKIERAAGRAVGGGRAERGRSSSSTDYPKLTANQVADLLAYAQEAWPVQADRDAAIARIVQSANEQGRTPVEVQAFQDLPKTAANWVANLIREVIMASDDVPQ